jgi:diguanylate cyclase (GGDEF)-like protein
MTTENSKLNTAGRKILLIGDVHKAVGDAPAAQLAVCRVCVNMLDGIDTAAKERFSLIAVVMNGNPARLKAALRSLRHVSPGARIVLLAQMHQEPAAKSIVETETNGTHFASDYLICPVGLDSLLPPASAVEPEIARPPAAPIPIQELPKTAPPAVAAPDLQTQMRIQQLEKLATEDELTGLKNRRYIWEFARQIIERAKKTDGRVTLLMFDIDDFKHYNDKFGHPFGDEILRQAAVLMRRCCRTHDAVARIGGDEFAVVFWDDPKRKAAAPGNERRSADAVHPSEAISVAKRFRNELGKTDLSLLGPAGKGVLTISGGLASFPRDGATPDQLFRQADKALLEAKRSGKNRIYLVGKPESDIGDIQ